MSEKFQNKYRIPSARLQTWDYRWDGAYFITICCKNMVHYFGDVQNRKMVLSPIGVIADLCWFEIKNHAKNIELGEFIIMPNHMHGILILNDMNNPSDGIPSDGMIPSDVQTRHALSLSQSSHSSISSHSSHSSHSSESQNTPPPTIGQQRFQNQGKNSISSIVGGYKSAVTKHARRLGFDFYWQPRFYDHIIRDDKSYQNIKNYIINNPSKWYEDKFCGI